MNTKSLLILIVLVIIILGGIAVAKGGLGTEIGLPAIQEIQDLSPLPQAEKKPEDSIIAEPSENEVVVEVNQSGFTPATLNINTGTRVVWKNSSGQIIVVASDPHPQHTNYPTLNLGQVKSGEAVSLTFDQAGSYSYHDHLNPSRKGTIVVL